MYGLLGLGMPLTMMLIYVESTTTKYYLLAAVILVSFGSVAVALSVKEYRDNFKKYYLYIVIPVALMCLISYYILF